MGRIWADGIFGRDNLQHEVETRVGRAMIAGQVVDGAKMQIDAQNGSLTVDIVVRFMLHRPIERTGSTGIWRPQQT